MKFHLGSNTTGTLDKIARLPKNNDRLRSDPQELRDPLRGRKSSRAKLGTASDGRLPQRTGLRTKRLLPVSERCVSKELGPIERPGALYHLTS